MSEHERYETLLMKAVDGVITPDEQRVLNEHIAECGDCAAELHDFKDIKETTDAMTQRILQDAQIEPPREAGGARVVLSLSFLFLLVGALLLLGFAGYTFAVAADVPPVVKWGAALAAAGSLGLFGYAFRARWRARGRDPYSEIDR